jgi:Reverse transcriptase (RNA-dependent DNA polymerase)
VGFLTEHVNFKKSVVDPCLLYKEENEHKVFLCLYVDDVLLIGNNLLIKSTISEIKKKYSIKEVGKLDECVGCKIKEHNDALYIYQPDLINKMEAQFNPLIKNRLDYDTPDGHGDQVVRPKTKAELITDEEQKVFRSGVGILLYLTKHSRPEISNSVRELAKVMDGANAAHMKMLGRVLKYVVGSRNKCLVLNPIKNKSIWVLFGRCDSDYAGDKDQRLSISGYVVYANNALVSWKSKSQRNTTLSSTEAEYVALCEICKEIYFLKMLIESMGQRVQLPIKVYIDNVGAMFLANNSTTGQRTKHIDVRYHYSRELIASGIVLLEFVRTLENDSDIYTKNVGNELFLKHIQQYIHDCPAD